MKKFITAWGSVSSITDRRPETYAKDVTLRYPLACNIRGNKIRLRFSNFCGTEPVTLSKVTVAKTLAMREFDEKTIKDVTFGGKASATIPAGGELVSDEIYIPFDASSGVTVCIYLKDFTLMRSSVVAIGPLSHGFYSSGDRTKSGVLPLDFSRSTDSVYFLTGLDVFGEGKGVICYGDSWTAQSWPDYLSMLCGEGTAVVRKAASGTRVLREYKCMTYESYGLSGAHRFEREIDEVCGADSVIIQHGINDIIHPVGVEVNPFRPMSDLPTVKELEDGLLFYIDKAKARSLKVYMGTLLPIGGWRTYAPFREEMRVEINEFIRNLKGIDGVVDFDAALRSSSDPTRVQDNLIGADRLHPSEEGYKVMAKEAYKVLTGGNSKG